MPDGGVINEFTNVTRRKLRWDWGQIEASLAVIEELLGVARPLTAGLHAKAVVLSRDSKLAFYDALIVAAAMDAGCELLCSDDLQDGQQFGAVTVVNPFRR
jgi:predicted nucleic acid-binding protein